MVKEDNEEKNKIEVTPLISIYLKDGDISYAYSDENSDIITDNNLLLCGNLEKIKQELLDLDLDLEEEE